DQSTRQRIASRGPTSRRTLAPADFHVQVIACRSPPPQEVGKADPRPACSERRWKPQGSVRLAGGCEGLHDLVDAGFKPGDRQRFLKKRKRAGALTHRLVIIDAPPLRVHRHLRAVCAGMQAGRNKPGARRTETSVASVRSSTSRRWFAGSTVNTLIKVTTSLFAEIVVIASLPSGQVVTRPERRSCRPDATGSRGARARVRPRQPA